VAPKKECNILLGKREEKEKRRGEVKKLKSKDQPKSLAYPKYPRMTYGEGRRPRGEGERLPERGKGYGGEREDREQHRRICGCSCRGKN